MKSPAPPIIPLPNGLKLALQSQQQLGCANFIVQEIFRNQVYRRPGFELHSTDTVVDIGGNVGLFALWAAPQVARVVSIEPTRAIDCLEQSLILNGVQNVSTVRCAISDKSGTIELLEYPGFNGVTHASIFQPVPWEQRLIKLFWPKEQEKPIRVSCPSQSLDQVLQTQEIARIDFLKVDCEGGEYAIFDSISDETLGRISRIAMEFHKLHPSHDYRRIVNRLKSAGYEVTIERTLVDRYISRAGMLFALRKT